MNLFEKEILKSEYQRSALLVILFVVGLDLLYVATLLVEDFFDLDFGLRFNITLLYWSLVFLVYETVIILTTRYFLKKNRGFLTSSRYINIFIEISFITILLLLQQPDHHLNAVNYSYFFILYIVYLTLGLLHMELKVILFSFSVIFIQFIGSSLLYNLSDPTDIYLKSALLFMLGITISYVTALSKKFIQKKLTMQQKHQEMNILFKQQVSPEITQELFNRVDKRVADITVLVMDIRNFSVYASQNSPEAIMDFQNRIFSPVIEIIAKNHGVVHQILGDGVMASFGISKESSKSHANLAIGAALEILQAITKNHQQNRIPLTNIGIGLDSGGVAIGNIGNEYRKQYSISGTTVITAFRIEQLNKELGTQILMTANVKSRLTNKNIAMIPLGLKMIKGFNHGVDVFSIVLPFN